MSREYTRPRSEKQENGHLDNPLILGYVWSACSKRADRFRTQAHNHPIPGLNRSRETYLVIAAGALVWCSAILAAPVMASAGQGVSSTADVLYTLFHHVCHQFESRSFHLFGEPLAVCERCASIYVSFLIGVLLYPLLAHISSPRIPPRPVLIVAAVPVLLDVALTLFNVHEGSTITRVLSGSMFGVVAPFYIIPAATEAIHQFLPDHTPSTDLSYMKGSSHE